MNLYIDKDVKEIPVIRNLLRLLDGVLNDPEIAPSIVSVDDIDKVEHLWDPVDEFINFYKNSSGIEISEDRQVYIKSSLYAAKGSIKVFDILSEVLELKLNYEYNFPVIKLVNFNDIRLQDLETFLEKLTSMLYYLIYYTEVKIEITNMILNVRSTILDYKSAYTKNFQIIIAKWD